MAKTNERMYRIRGKKPLCGEVTIAGAKNASTKELVAALLTDERVCLENVPRIGDVDVTLSMLEHVGATIQRTGSTVSLVGKSVKTSTVSEAFSRKNRIPILLIGPLLHRFGKAVIPALGGCTIGARPIDFHLEAIRSMGAEITLHNGKYLVTASRGLRGAHIALPFPSVGATENILLAAVCAKGTTVISNAAVEPEILDLAKLLQSMGAIINLEVNRTWVIEGVPKLHGATHRVLPDRIEAASFAVAAAITGGDVLVKGARQEELMSFLNALRRAGVEFHIEDEGIRFIGPQALHPIALETDVHPGFMTDWQQPFVMLLTQAAGVSIVHETVYEDRFGYTESLNAMGANIQLHRECLGGKTCRFANGNYRHSGVIVGPTPLHGAEIRIPDLRAGFSYLIAALIAEGESRITNVELIERGYEDIIGKLQRLGADIQTQ